MIEYFKPARRGLGAVLVVLAVGWAGSARADLVPCQSCSASNPLTLAGGSIFASGTDGEGLVSNGNSITWGAGLTNNLLGGNLNASADYPPPGQINFESASAMGTLNVSQPNTLPSISLSAHASNSNPYGLSLGGASAGGSISYQVMVIRAAQAGTYNLPAGSYSCGSTFTCDTSNDPVDGTPVRIDVHGQITGDVQNAGSGQPDSASGSGDITLTRDSDGTLIAATSQAGAFNVTVGLIVGTVYDVQLDASLNINGNASGSVFVDPSFAIDVSDPSAGLVTLLFSNGVGRDDAVSAPSQVPEPSSVALVLAGLVGVVVAGRFRLEHLPG